MKTCGEETRKDGDEGEIMNRGKHGNGGGTRDEVKRERENTVT